MPRPYTPLRYPGGKAKLAPFLASLFEKNRLVDGHYAEAYAGGAGAALYLLLRGYVTQVHLNDIDRGVASFWRALLRQNERFVRELKRVPLTVEEWDRQREAYRTSAMGFELGFAFFYLNRTNRSGIMNGGIIGGRAQRGEWKIDARFERDDLAQRVEAVGSMKRAISFTRLDAIDFVDGLAQERKGKCLLYLDPPYYKAGRELYPNFYVHDDHVAIAKKIRRTTGQWLLTYDDCPEVRDLYSGCRVVSCDLCYSAREVRRGREVIVAAPGLKLPASPKSARAGRPPLFQLHC